MCFCTTNPCPPRALLKHLLLRTQDELAAEKKKAQDAAEKLAASEASSAASAKAQDAQEEHKARASALDTQLAKVQVLEGRAGQSVALRRQRHTLTPALLVRLIRRMSRCKLRKLE